MKFQVKMALVGAAAACMSLPVVAQDTTSADKSFLEDSAQGSLFEINMAKLALQKSKDPNVTKFATKMIHDHEMLIKDMKPFMVKLKAKPASGPSLVQKAKYEALKLKSGISFDRSYVESMVSDHNDDLKAFYKEESTTSNAELKAAVAKGAETIKEHTTMIDDIAHQGGIEDACHADDVRLAVLRGGRPVWVGLFACGRLCRGGIA